MSLFTSEQYSSLTRTLDHFVFQVPEDQFDAVVAWYLAALAPINYKKILEFPGVIGIGSNRPDFWIKSDKNAPSNSHFHLAFRADG